MTAKWLEGIESEDPEAEAEQNEPLLKQPSSSPGTVQATRVGLSVGKRDDEWGDFNNRSTHSDDADTDAGSESAYVEETLDTDAGDVPSGEE